MKLIPLSTRSNRRFKNDNFYAKVDDDDYDFLMQWKWHIRKEGNRYYAARNITLENGNKRILKMHRVIMNTPKGMDTDHINHNGIDNQKLNLRVCTRRQNIWNSRCHGKSGYNGVHLERQTNKWKAQISINGRQTHLGRFDSPVEAAKAYDKAAVKLMGEFANTNFKAQINEFLN